MKTKELVLISDIGGTNVRFGLYQEGQTDIVNFDGKYKCNEFRSFEEAVLFYLKEKHLKPTLCVIGAAGNINEYTGEVLSTNTPWKASVPSLKAKCPFFKHIRMVNDFALQGWALSEMDKTQIRQLFHDSSPIDLTKGKIVVIGPGTGLGTCLIMQDGKKPQTIYTSEAGHSTIPHVDFNNETNNADRNRLLDALKEYYAQKNQKPVTEHLVSGTGITNIYHAFKDGIIPLAKEQRIPAEHIEALAKSTVEIALKTFYFFNAYLGAHSGTLAAATKTDTIFFCGGLMASPWVLNQLEKSSIFMQQFTARAGMSEAMKHVRFVASRYRDMSTLGAVVRAKHLIEITKNEQEKNRANQTILYTLAALELFVHQYCPEALKNVQKVKTAIQRQQKIYMQSKTHQNTRS